MATDALRWSIPHNWYMYLHTKCHTFKKKYGREAFNEFKFLWFCKEALLCGLFNSNLPGW